MSTLKTTSITHGSNSGTANLTLASDGKVTVAEKKLVCPGTIIQVVQTVDQADYTSGTNAVASGGWWTPSVTVAITPTATSSKILFTGHVVASAGNSPMCIRLRVNKAGSALAAANGEAAGSRSLGHSGGSTHADDYVCTLPINYLDSPSSTSAVTYGFSLGHHESSSQTMNIGKNQTDSDADDHGRYPTILTVMEIAG